MSANKTPRVLGALLAAGLGVSAGLRVANRPATVRHADDVARMSAAYDSLPLSFEPNRGQAPGEVRFSARGDGYGLFLTSNQAVLAMKAPKGTSAESALLRMHLRGARKDARSAGAHKLPGISNYFFGKDPGKWRTHVPNYAQVKYDGVYPGVDLVYYGNQRRLEYDFLVKPGADPSAIRLGFEGADRVSIDKAGDLVLEMQGRSIRQHRPVIYQQVDGVRKPVSGGYQLLAKNEVGFNLAGYDQSKPLIIDPVLSYSGYLGGTERDVARNIAVDPDGNAYITGITFSADLPVTPGAAQAALRGTSDAFVTKVRSDGRALIYSSYLGGAGDENRYLKPDLTEVLSGAVAIDEQRRAYLTGYTDSNDFPLVAPIQVVNGGNGDAFVTKLSEDGGILFSTYLGGRERDAGNGIAIAQSADGPNAYVIGETRSHDFNIANPYQQFKGGDNTGSGTDSDAFVTRLNAAGSGLVYSTYLGGTNDEFGQAIAVGPNGNVYATGVTLSNNFPITANAFAPTGVGSSDIFITKLRDLGAQDDPAQLIEYSSYFGGTGENNATAIAVDRLGRAYITGYTTSEDLPTVHPTVIPGTYDGSFYGGRSGADGSGSEGFVAKFDPSEAGAASLVQSTYLGGNGLDVATGISLNPVSADPASGDYVAYVTGWTTSSNFPTVAALRTSPVGGQDIFVSKITAGGTSFEYSTYLGGSVNDVASGIAVDSTGRAYITGSTLSGNYPVILTGTSKSGAADKSDLVLTRLISPPGAPSALTGIATGPTQIDLTWSDNSDNEGDAGGVGFQIERSTGGGSFLVVGSTAPNVATFSDGLSPTFPLQPETSYVYRVRAVSTVGASAYSNAITVQTLSIPPVDPSGLSATAISQTSVRLDWTDNSSNETGFEIERAPETSAGSGQPGTFAAVGTAGANATTYVDSGLAVFTTYFYQIRATNSGGPSGYAGPVSVKTFDTIPTAPTNLSAVTVSNTSIQLSWTDTSNNEIGFEVQRSLDGFTFTSVTTSLLTNTTQYTDTGLAGNTIYTYRVRAFNTGGNSAFTNEASATTFPNPPSAPSGLTVTVPPAPNGITRLTLNWTDSNNESGFKIERSTDNFLAVGNTILVTTTGANVTSYTDSGLSANTNYYYRVRATNAGGDSANSNTANATTLPNPPTAPSTLTATALSQKVVRLDWVDNSTNETGFKVERSLDGTTYTAVTTTGANEITYTDNDPALTAYTRYYYRVRGTNAGGDSAPSNVATVTTLPNAPTAPTALAGVLQVIASPYSIQVDLSWTDTSNNETGFKIERSTDGLTYGQIAMPTAETRTYSDVTVSADRAYSYRVIATNAGGDSAPSNVITVNTPPAAPTNARLSGITKNSVQLFWNDNSSTETNFQIQRSPDGIVFTNLQQVAANMSSFTDTGLTGGTKYYYRVYAVNGSGSSDASNIIDGLTLPEAPAAPIDLTATAVSQSRITLSWTDQSTNEDGFKIERSTDSVNYSQIAVTAAGVEAYDDTPLNIGTHYWYRVRAYNTGDDSGYSNTADATTFPAAPTGPTGLTVAVNSSSSLTLTWRDNSTNEDTFRIERSLTSSFGSIDRTASVAGSNSSTATFTDTQGLSPNATYYYRVIAVNLGGESGYSNPASALTLPGAPTELTADGQSNGTIKVSWKAPVGGADSYLVEHSSSVSPTVFTEVGRTGSGVTTIFDTGLSPNSTFNYRVKAINRSGASTYSNQDDATTTVGLASVSVNKTTIKGGNTLQLTVTLTGPAPANGATVTLTSLGDGGVNVKVPPSVSIPAGSTTVTVKVKTKKPKRVVVATITGTYLNSSKSIDVTVKK